MLIVHQIQFPLISVSRSLTLAAESEPGTPALAAMTADLIGRD